MTDHATANLPSRDLDKTAAFYQALGFSIGFKDDGWMILSRGDPRLEFFPHAGLDPRTSCFSACLRVDDLDALHAAFSASDVPHDCWSMPRIDKPQMTPFGLRMFHLVDLDGSLLRCIDNQTAI
ncbi:MAG: bleomycin resistance protein [Terricaulis sp.]